ncbi:hypothetical protein MTDSW087_04300 [Methylobacterium dankookense]|uniref:Uncharacterized protein n=1 Tax=Methylobacterium dankookense TaxID=560405 RepID=A0A564G2A5_9HYPH|nr:hypothetical protein IFDJLNFL_5312 [Methylobacterium dankookense]VUF14575.1 hypothetical protein MTDSW087_04300 [Methylobacterium dankookense]
MTVVEIAAARRLTLAEAQKLVDELRCPKLFRAQGTLYLL